MQGRGGRGRGGGGGGEGVYLESYTREARFLTRWDQHAVLRRRRRCLLPVVTAEASTTPVILSLPSLDGV